MNQLNADSPSENKTTMTVLVTGARGWIGRFVCRWLSAAGCMVRKTVRQSPAIDEFVWDCTRLGHHSQLNQALEGCHAVVHCASHVHRSVENSADASLFQQVNVEGTRQLVAGCLAVGVNRIVYASTVAIYGWSDAGAKDEDAPVSPSSHYCRTKLEGEDFVRTSGLDWRIARLATVYGTGDKANFLKLASALKATRFWIPGPGRARKSVLPITRAAELLGRLAMLHEPSYRLVNLASTHTPDLREICDAFSTVCGFRRARSLPSSLMRRVARLGDSLSWAGFAFPLTSHGLQKLTTDTVVNVRRQQILFGDLVWGDFCEDLMSFRDYYR